MLSPWEKMLTSKCIKLLKLLIVSFLLVHTYSMHILLLSNINCIIIITKILELFYLLNSYNILRQLLIIKNILLQISQLCLTKQFFH